MKTVEVEYIESGTFQGGEEDVSRAKIEYGETCFVVRKKDLDEWKKAEASLRRIAKKYGINGTSSAVAAFLETQP